MIISLGTPGQLLKVKETRTPIVRYLFGEAGSVARYSYRGASATIFPVITGLVLESLFLFKQLRCQLNGATVNFQFIDLHISFEM